MRGRAVLKSKKFVVLAGTTAQAEIVCTNHRGCFETGGRIFRTGGRVIVGQTIINHRDGQKDWASQYA